MRTIVTTMCLLLCAMSASAQDLCAELERSFYRCELATQEPELQYVWEDIPETLGEFTQDMTGFGTQTAREPWIAFFTCAVKDAPPLDGYSPELGNYQVQGSYPGTVIGAIPLYLGGLLGGIRRTQEVNCLTNPVDPLQYYASEWNWDWVFGDLPYYWDVWPWRPHQPRPLERTR